MSLSTQISSTRQVTSGFQKTVAVPTDSTQTSGQVLGTEPAAGQNVPLDTVIQIQVSKGNQFVMPDLKGQFWTDAEPNLRGLGWTGTLIKLPNADNSGVRSNGVVTQSPPAGSAVNFGAPITISFAS